MSKFKILNFLFILVNFITLHGASEKLKSLSEKYGVIIDNIEEAKGADKFKLSAQKEISSNQQIFIIPTENVLSSQSEYQFKEFFSKNNKQRLIGHLLIQKFVGNESYYHYYIQNLPKPNELLDYYHFTDTNKLNLEQRSLVKFQFSNRRADYDSLISRSRDISNLLLNWESYNWAASIVDCYGMGMKMISYPEVRKIYRILNDNSEEVILIPGVEIFKSGKFKLNIGNNVGSSLFAYKDHIYLNSDRYIDEGEEIFNEINFLPNIQLFEFCGKVSEGYFHEEISINISPNQWTLKKFNLCYDLNCMKKGSNFASFTLKYDFNHKLLKFCQVDSLEDQIPEKEALKLINNNQKISKNSYLLALSGCTNYLKKFVKNSKKTTLEQDIQDIGQQKYTDERDFNIMKFSISQKKLVNYQIKVFSNRIIKEFAREISEIKGRYT